ncbi:MAG: hybrid sensor histidine kinase/response regulator [Myxococcota bacterium]
MDHSREAMEEEASKWTHDASADLSGPEPTAQTRKLIRGVFDSYLSALLDDNPEPLTTFIGVVIEIRGKMLFHVSTPQRGFFSFRRATHSQLLREQVPQEQLFRILVEIDDVYVQSMYRLADGFSAKLNSTFESLYEEARHASAAKQNFLATMSHELRTPLNAILGTGEALQEAVYGPLTQMQREALSNIEVSGHHLLALVNDLLDLSKIEAGALDPVIAQMSLADLCSECVQVMRTSARRGGIRLGLSMDGEADEISSDVRYIRQMVLNLLSNAVKFTPEGGRVSVSLENRGAEVAISVTDTGVGIAPEDQPKLFGAFSRIDSGLSTKPAGTGLGLHLTRRLVTVLGGRIEYESEPGKGSCFTLLLPTVMPSADPQAHETSITAPGAVDAHSIDAALGSGAHGDEATTPATSGLDVLLVDDTPGNISHVYDFLVKKGHNVKVGTNGLEGIEMAQLLPDIIFMDVQMPVMDGLEATRRLRADPHTRDLFIVALTSYAMGEDKERCLAAGADLHESKPVRLKRLLELVESQSHRKR